MLHLQGVQPNANFVGFSKAATDGYLTQDQPPEPEDWDYAAEHYRVDLEEFVRLPDPVNLTNLFAVKREEMTEYFHLNRERNHDRRLLFFVEQRLPRREEKRLQCLNGAYLSELDDRLFDIMFPEGGLLERPPGMPPVVTVATSEQLRNVKVREGQRNFSEAIKFQYGNRCCFPGCNVRDPRFLVGAHIARWADNPDLRGQIGNGLCLCVFHDKAFEVGLFTLDLQFNVHLNQRELNRAMSPALELRGAQGRQINLGPIPPIEAALREHWRRIGCRPPEV